MKERLRYFIYYYRPYVQRRQFIGIIFLVMVFSTALDYLIFPKIDLASHILLPPVMVLAMYLLIFLLAIFDYLILNKGAIALNFFMFERDFIQQFSLALFFPVVCLAYVLKTCSLMFLYPSQGIFPFKSLAGLTGGICVAVGLIGYLL